MSIEYVVKWEIVVDADSKQEAAERALEMHRDSQSIATVFEVAEFNNADDEFEEIDVVEEN